MPLVGRENVGTEVNRSRGTEGCARWPTSKLFGVCCWFYGKKPHVLCMFFCVLEGQRRGWPGGLVISCITCICYPIFIGIDKRNRGRMVISAEAISANHIVKNREMMYLYPILAMERIRRPIPMNPVLSLTYSYIYEATTARRLKVSS